MHVNLYGVVVAAASDIYKIVKMIMEREYQPVIVFSFSKRECEAYALQMSKLDFNSQDEKDMVEKVRRLWIGYSDGYGEGAVTVMERVP